ncbi:MAG: hypothetical protein ACRENS_02340 [Candidatus Eiseniibacteriota bacterium]
MIALLACAPPGAARASWQAPLRAADADTSLEQFLGGLKDSTDQYFGRTAASLDTAGLDSARSANFNRSHPHGRRGPVRPEFNGSFRFNRVDGPVYGGSLALATADEVGRLSGRALYVVGPNEWQWSVGWHRHWGGLEGGTTVDLSGGEETSTMDRLLPVGVGDPLATLGALVRGYDARYFLRRDGWTAAVHYQRNGWRGILGWRDAFEHQQATTTSWNFASRALDPFENLPATRGRAREALAALGGRTGHLPIQFEGSYRVSSPELGSDFDYRVARLALGGDFALGRSSALVPQIAFGQVNRNALPQESFFLGGVSTLTTLRTARLAGSSAALARLDWIGTRDLLALAHIPHPAYLPLQGNAFAASGAISGTDPFGGPRRAGDVWSNPGAWNSEGGLALVWQPGLPDPTSMGRLSVAWPLGPNRHQARVTLTFSRALFMLEPTSP